MPSLLDEHRSSIVVCMAVIFSACTSPAPKPDTGIRAGAAVAEATPVVATAKDAKARSASSAHKGPAFKPPPGFKPKIDGWELVYCKEMPMLGSRFPKQLCMSEAQLKDYMAGNAAMRQNKDQVSRICPTPGACGEGLE